MNELILTCSCPGTPKFATEAFSLLFPERLHPIMVTGSKKILQEASRPQNLRIKDYLMALAKNKEKFAYYIRYDEDKIYELWDLKKGVRVAC